MSWLSVAFRRLRVVWVAWSYRLHLWFLPIGAVLAIGLTLSFASREVRKATLLGVVAGPVASLWLVAPHVLSTHFLRPENAVHWAVLIAMWSGLFGGLGILLCWVGSWPIGLIVLLRRSTHQLSSSVLLAWSTAVFPIVYLGLCVLILRLAFRQYPDLRELVGLAWAIAGFSTAVVGTLGVVSFASRRFGLDPKKWSSSAIVLAAFVVPTLVALPIRVPIHAPMPQEAVPGIDLEETRSTGAPLLFVGLDAAGWQVLHPLMEQGRLPTLSGLIGHGAFGVVEAAWPPYWSTPAWGAILTGHDLESIGVHENFVVTAPGLPTYELPLTTHLWTAPVVLSELIALQLGAIDVAPTSREHLRRPPIWERLTDAGLNVAVVFFPFTYPATGQAQYVVSNRAAADVYSFLGVREGAPGSVLRAGGATEQLDRLFAGPRRASDTDLSMVLDASDWPQPEDALVDPVEYLRAAFVVGEKTFEATKIIMNEDRALDVVMLYIGEFDSVGHAFWPYRFPDEFEERPSSADVAALGPVVDRYLELVDSRIGEVMAAFPSRPNTLVVSDHGMEASEFMTIWKGWHSPEGVFLAGGPDIPDLQDVGHLSYLDVVPTLLGLVGARVPPDLEGRSVLVRAR